MDENDPAFRKPTKPVGAFYDKATAERIAAEKGYTMVEDAGRGYRQVVPSPKPVDVIEKNTVRALINGGCVVITVGGGGIPVVRRDGKLYGTPAVIDKDFASAKLAELVQADALVILTAVDRVCINWGKPDQKSLAEMTVAEAERYCEEGHFAPGSMLPKVRAAVSFAKTGGQAIIASLAQAGAAVSGNILKNVKSVVVPNTGGRKGIGPAIAVGLVAGDAARDLQVISAVTEKQLAELDAYLQRVDISVSCSHSPCQLDIDLRGSCGGHTARVRITNHHTNIVCLERDGEVLRELPVVDSAEEHRADKSLLNVADILRFAAEVPLEDLLPLLEPQVSCNSAIAEEGLRGAWGAQIGRILLEDYGDDIKQRAKAYAAAGSDARMSGCEMPVVILSGSGNQGITACMPVVAYARHIGATREQLYRALAVSDLVTVHQKTGIGRLSAYCGAISAGVGAGAGICYLLGGDYDAVAHTVVNAVAILSGTICDGAKPSCAAKIAAAVDAGIMGYRMYLHHREFRHGEGIVGSNVDDTIAKVGVLAQQGMRQTDRTILDIMQDRCS